MNTSGCDPAFARDSLFIPPGTPGDPPCTLLMPLYFIPLAFYIIILGSVAVVRTMLVLRKRGSTRNTGGSFLSPLVPWVIVTASWMTVGVLLLHIIIPTTYGTGNNVMTFLIGLQYLSFNILGERWLRKLVRLGTKIIMPNYKASKQVNSSDGGSAQESAQDKAMDALAKSDAVLKIIDVFVVITISVQVTAFCVLSMVFPQDSTWIHVGLGLQGFDVWLTMFAIVWQYERCNNAITSTNIGLKDVTRSGGQSSKRGVNAVQSKFRRHQLILLCTGLTGGLIFILWGAGVIPLNYILIIVTGLYDSVINGSILVTFVVKRGKRASQTDKTKTSTMNNALVPRSTTHFHAESTVG